MVVLHYALEAVMLPSLGRAALCTGSSNASFSRSCCIARGCSEQLWVLCCNTPTYRIYGSHILVYPTHVFPIRWSVHNNLLHTISYNLKIIMCLNALSFGYMTHICCDVIVCNCPTTNSVQKYIIRERKLWIRTVLKQEQNLLTTL